MKKVLCIGFIFLSMLSHAQNSSSNFRSKKIELAKDTVKIDSVSINPVVFKIYSDDKTLIEPTSYNIDFTTSTLIIDRETYPTITVEYYVYPEFLTKTYSRFDESIIVPQATPNAELYSFTNNRENAFFKPFDGLNTSGSISRGLTVGNNQDAVVNSALDLQIAGKLSDKVTLRASITDSNIPIQENGYTQQLNEFDRVFIELFTDTWSIKAGDVDLYTNNSYFANFTKKVSGISIGGTINHDNAKTNVFASGALVRGKFTNYSFIGEESNQGPYRIFGPNNEQYIVIISGSETVYVNGIPLQRGENNDYIIDYNTAEITFMPTFPINANMRISIDFQYSDQNYNRFITHNGANYESDKFTIGGSYYLESDAKNQPVQQDLTDEQKQILADAGNDTSKMVAPSAVEDTYSENKILYRKEIVGGIETFIYSNDPEDELYNVTFSFVGENVGSYDLSSTIATGKIYEYVGTNLGEYAPVIQLIAPNKLQVIVVNSAYNPSEKTTVAAELALSQNDQNLYSDIDNETNDGSALKVAWDQSIIDKKWDLKSSVNYERISEHFQSIERFRNVEFNRDWNLLNPIGNQDFLQAKLILENPENGTLLYNFELLKFSDSFDGIRNNLLGDLTFNRLKLNFISSVLNSESTLEENYFFRLYSVAKYSFNTSWIGAKLNTENNEIKAVGTEVLSPLSQQFKEYEGFFGIGDSTKVFAEIGVNIRENDSVKTNTLAKVNTANTYFLKSQLIQKKQARLSMFVNYREVENVDFEDTKALNSRIVYYQQLFNNMVNFNTVYETVSGNLPQQEFTYIEVEPGQGFYTWIDYNSNGIKELDEFEIAQFQDEATYLRVALPTLNYLQTHQVKFSQSLNINLQQWSNQDGFKKMLSHFQNQTYLLVDNKQERIGDSFNLNPFETENLLGLNSNFRSSLFFNRGQQKYSSTYSFLTSRIKTNFTIDEVESRIQLHQLQFVHKFGTYWLLDAKGSWGKNTNTSESFPTRDYDLTSSSFNPSLAYLQNSTTELRFFYDLRNKENTIGAIETLTSHKMGVLFKAAKGQNTLLNADFNFYINDFEGNENSPVAYQMLEGLEPGNNFTWSLLWQQNLTNFLDLNVSYLGRKSENNKAIHTGTVQLRANF